MSDFEVGRIADLQNRRVQMEIKTYTNWINSVLRKADLQITDLFTDLCDGTILIKMLEILTGDKLRIEKGKNRFHKMSNINTVQSNIYYRVPSEDVVDGSQKAILSLVFQMIQKYHVREIKLERDSGQIKRVTGKTSSSSSSSSSANMSSPKQELLKWCQQQTSGYDNVNITDFSGSWRDGLAFNALIHVHRNDLVNFDQLDEDNHIDNLNNAFDIADNSLGIPKLLDAEDVDADDPDENSILTYVASYFHTFSAVCIE